MSKEINKTTATATATATVDAPVVNIEAPKTIVAALGKLAQATEKEKASYRDTAVATRKWGRETTLKPEEIRLALAKSIAQGFGVDLDTVTTSPKKFKTIDGKSAKEVSLNGVLYSLRSTLSGIANPSSDERKAAVDAAIDNDAATWQDIVAASRAGSNREGKPTEGKEKDAKPLTEEQLAQKVAFLVSAAAHAEIPAQNVFDILVAATMEQMKKDYAKVITTVKFAISA